MTFKFKHHPVVPYHAGDQTLADFMAAIIYKRYHGLPLSKGQQSMHDRIVTTEVET